MNIRKKTPVVMQKVKPKQSYSEKQEQQMALEESIIMNKALRIDFSCGVSMARINVDINTRFGLKWHFENTKSLNDFLDSVKSFLGDKNPLSSSDMALLTNEYTKSSR